MKKIFEKVTLSFCLIFNSISNCRQTGNITSTEQPCSRVSSKNNLHFSLSYCRIPHFTGKSSKKWKCFCSLLVLNIKSCLVLVFDCFLIETLQQTQTQAAWPSVCLRFTCKVSIPWLSGFPLVNTSMYCAVTIESIKHLSSWVVLCGTIKQNHGIISVGKAL